MSKRSAPAPNNPAPAIAKPQAAAVKACLNREFMVNFLPSLIMRPLSARDVPLCDEPDDFPTNRRRAATNGKFGYEKRTGRPP